MRLFSRLLDCEETYLGPAAVQALNVGTRLTKIVSVVENLFVATAWLVLHVIQRTNLALGFDIYFLRRDLRTWATNCIIYLLKFYLVSG